jgi:hypothetical protein
LEAHPGYPELAQQIVTSPLVEVSKNHDPQKCQFRPMTKKGKLKIRLCTLSWIEDLFQNKFSPVPSIDSVIPKPTTILPSSSSEDKQSIRIQVNSTPYFSLLVSIIFGNNAASSMTIEQRVARFRFEILSALSLMRRVGLPIKPVPSILNDPDRLTRLLDGSEQPIDNEWASITLIWTAIRSIIRDISFHMGQVACRERGLEEEDWELDRLMVSERRMKLGIVPHEVPKTTERRVKTLTPYHVFRVLWSLQKRYDFLGNWFLEGENVLMKDKKEE